MHVCATTFKPGEFYMQLGKMLQNEQFNFSLFDWLYIYMYINTVLYVLQPNFKALTVCKLDYKFVKLTFSQLVIRTIRKWVTNLACTVNN